MKIQVVFPLVLVCLLVFLPAGTLSQMQQQLQAPTVEISKPKVRPLTLTFSPRDLEQIGANPQVLLKRLDRATKLDCEYRNRISSCIWACRNGRKVRTCHPTLVRALETVWPR